MQTDQALQTDQLRSMSLSVGTGSLRSMLPLLAILFMGLFLRIHDLGTKSIWLDEAISVGLAKSTLPQMFTTLATEKPHVPLYFTILHFWVMLFGDSEAAVRSLSALFGFLALLATYKVASLLFDREVGALSSLILGLSDFHIYYSQETRMYSLLVLLTLLSMYFFVKVMKAAGFTASILYIL